MRILQVIPVFSDSFGGPVTAVRSLSKELAKKHNVVIYTTTALDLRHDVNNKKEKVNGYKVIYFPRTFKRLSYSYLLGQLNFSSSLIKAVKENLKKFDIIHVHSWQQFPEVLVHHYTKKYNIPYVLQVHGSLPIVMSKKRLKWIYNTSIGYRILKDASKVIALTRIEAQQYTTMGVAEEKIAIIPNGIDLSEYANLPPRGSFKNKINIPKSEKIVLYLGRIHRIKGVDILVNSFSRIINKVNNVTLIIAGPNDGYLNEIQRLIKTQKIENKVLIVGPIYGFKKIAAYVDADIYVLPSRYDTFPMTILEAIACKTPIILTENCGITEYFRDKVGVIVKPDPILLSKKLLNILLNDNLRSFFRKNCKTVIEEFNILNTVSKLEKVYEEIVK